MIDEITPNIEKSINYIRLGHSNDTQENPNEKIQVNIRMITGDHLETARHVALKTGILSKDQETLDGTCMTGEEFEQAVGKFKKVWSSKDNEWVIKFADD